MYIINAHKTGPKNIQFMILNQKNHWTDLCSKISTLEVETSLQKGTVKVKLTPGTTAILGELLTPSQSCPFAMLMSREMGGHDLCEYGNMRTNKCNLGVFGCVALKFTHYTFLWRILLLKPGFACKTFSGIKYIFLFIFSLF